MATKFAFDSSNRIVSLVDSMPRIVDDLPLDIYSLRVTPTGELYLERIDEFGVPSEIFGDVEIQADRIVNTFNERPGVTGLLLTGEKGSGKSLLGKMVAHRLMEQNRMPVIAVNIPVSGDDFGIFLQKIGKPVTLFFDEFEKTYSHENAQNGLLTILDGIYPVKVMAVLTSNDDSKLIGPLINRPGRIFYKITYHGLDYKFVMEYAEKKLIDKSHLSELSRLAALVELNFDQLQALIEEMNRYGESVKDAVQLLNISTERDSFFGLRISSFKVNGVAIPSEAWAKPRYDGSLAFEDGPETFWYRAPNTESTTYVAWMDENQHDDYDVRENFGRSWGGTSMQKRDEFLPYIPANAKFDDNSQIEVARDGRITLTNEDGDEIVLEKPKRWTRKDF